MSDGTVGMMKLGWLNGRPRHDAFDGDDAGVSVYVGVVFLL